MALVLGTLAQDFLLGTELEVALVDSGLALAGTNLGNALNVLDAANGEREPRGEPPLPAWRGGDGPPPRPLRDRAPPPEKEGFDGGVVVLALGVALAIFG